MPDTSSSRWWNVTYRWWIRGPIILGCLVLLWLGRGACEQVPKPSSQASGEPPVYVCPMNISYHPFFSSSDPDAQCAFCGMPLELSEDAGGPARTEISDSARVRMAIETTAVERRSPAVEVRMVGSVDYDETSLAYITAWVGGRIERMFVDYTGVPVREGDHMVELYSPELIIAQEELLQAVKAVDALGDSDVAIVRERTEATIQIARDRLRLWGLTDAQIAEIQQRGTATDRVTIYAPVGGIVIDKSAQQGMYVQTGTRIYTIADLSGLWVNLQAYESDLQWLRYGQQVTFITAAAAGETFVGTISFISPVLDPKTRTVTVRVNADNAQAMLKPGMFVKAVVEATIAMGGRVMDAAMAGKWICPMHPSEIAAAPGQCAICEMPLVTTESLGYTAPDADAAAPLVVPASAVLLTGTRAVVYVQVPDADAPTYEWRVVELGPKAGDVYIVIAGLAEGDRVVTRGAFAIDSERQLKAKPSMMSSGDAPVSQVGGEKPPHAHAPAATTISEDTAEVLRGVYRAYFTVTEALASDDFTNADEAATVLVDAIAAGPDSDALWNPHAKPLADAAGALAAAEDIHAMRKLFEPLSSGMVALAGHLRPPGMTIYRLHCPMAMDNRGAEWLQLHDTTRNPYYGAAMLGCGRVTETFEEAADE